VTTGQDLPAAGDPVARSAVRLAFDRLLGGIFWGKIFAAAGVWVHGVVAAVVIFDASHSTLAVGMVSAAQFAPQLVLAPLCGKLADLYDERNLILLGQAMCGLGSSGLAIWLAVIDTGGWAMVWTVLGASFLVGLGIVLAGPAMQSVVPRLVPVHELPTAMALNTAPMTLARVVGPVAGAFLATEAGPGAGFGAAGAAQLMFLPILAGVRFPLRPQAPPGDRSVRGAVRHAWADRPVMMTLVAVCAAGMGLEPTITLASALAHALEGDASRVGDFTAAFGLGALVGVATLPPLARRMTHAWLTVSGIAMLGGGMAIAAVAFSATQVMVAFGLSGTGFLWLLTSATTLLQLRTPPSLRGRVMALWLMAFVGSRPVAATLVGSLSDAFSVRVALLGTAVLMLAIAVWCRPSRLGQ